jgi:hypothetical protein
MALESYASRITLYCTYCVLHSAVPKPFRKHFIAPIQAYTIFSHPGLNYVGLFQKNNYDLFKNSQFWKHLLISFLVKHI